MSVLIKGMDKPTECFFCPFKNIPTKPFTFCRKDNCPLEEVEDEDKCEFCYVAQNYNLEDDDSPCLNCGVEE